MSPFDFLNEINIGKKDLLREDPLNIKDYKPFMVNRGLSYFGDTVMAANEMNQLIGAPVLWQNDFLLHTIKKKKRFSKWYKKESDSKSLLIMEYYIHLFIQIIMYQQNYILKIKIILLMKK